MSKKVDERVVEMRFDNKQFESGVKDTMSTLDKFKQKLQLKDATKGLDDLEKTAKKVNLNPLGKSADAIAVKFSAMEVAGMTAIANITNSAVNMGKQIVKTFTLDPIMAGFQEYETQINSVQTILANTESKGSTLQDVNAALNELNKYADMTIYNFTEMTRNIGTFTAAGVDLKTSVSAIKGIANLAAVSGSTSLQASTAMYQLSQALAAGKVQLMDWNSVVNAGMGGQVFQDALKETARVHGVAIDAMIKKRGSFRETLQEGWLTAEVLTETLSKFTGDLSEQQLKQMGYTEEQIAGIIKMGKTANDAATKVKTFTQLFDTLKEAAQSGWTRSWEILIGDFGEAKEFLTAISDTLGDIINKSADARNAVLSGGLSSGWKQLLNAGIADEEGYKETLKSVVSEHGTSIDEMIKAEQKLDESLTDTEAFQKVLKKGLAEGTLTSDMFTESVHRMADKMSNMSAKELEAAGYTKDHVEQIKALSTGLKDGSVSMDEFVKKMSRSSGRENLIEALWNSFNGLLSVIKPIKEAFREVFPATTGEQLYSLTERIRDFTAKLKLSDKQAAKLKSTFKGIFSVINVGVTIIKSIVGGIATLIGKITGLSGGLLEISGSMGDWVSKMADGITEVNLFGKAIDGIVGFLGGAIDAFKEFTGAIGEKVSANGFEWFFNLLQGIWNVIQRIGSAIGTVAAAIGGALANAFRNGDFKSLLDILNGGIFASILLGIKKYISGITDKFDDAVGIVDKIKDVLGSVEDSLKSWQQNLQSGTIKNIAIAIGILAASLWVLSGIDSDKMASALTGIGVLMGELMGAMYLFTKITADAKSALKGIPALIGIAAAIFILASALKKLSDLNWDELKVGLTGIAGLVAIASGAMIALSKFTSKLDKFSEVSKNGIFKSESKKNLISVGLAMIAVAAAIKILASACKDLSGLNWNEISVGLTGIVVLLGSVTGAMIALSKFTSISEKASKDGALNSKSQQGLMTIGLAMIAMAAAMKILASACKDLSGLNWDELKVGLTGIVVMLGVVTGAMIALSRFSSKTGEVFNQSEKGIFSSKSKQNLISIGLSMIAIAAAMKIMASAAADFAEMEWPDLGKAGAAITAILGLTTGFLLLAGKAKNMKQTVGSLLIIAATMEIFAHVAGVFGEMEWPDLGKAGLAITGILGLVLAFSALAGKVKGDMMASATALLVVAAALLVLTPVLKTLGSMSFGQIVTGLVAIAGGLAIFIGAAALIQSFGLTPALYALAGSIALLGLACLAAGAGLALFAAGFTALAAAGAAGAVSFVAAITTIIIGILNLIPSIVDQLTAAIVAICNVIIQSAPAIGAALKELVLLAIDILVECIPQLAEGLFKMVIGVLDALAKYAPQIVAKLFEILIGIAESAAAALGAIDPETFLVGITAMVGLMAAFNVMASLAAGAMVGVLAFGAVIVELAAVLAILGGLAQIPGLEWLISEGGDFLQKIGTAIGQFIGGIVGGIAEGATSTLPQVGTNLSTFMTNLTPFIEGARLLDESLLTNVKTLASIILALTGAGILDAVTSWLTGGSSIIDFGAQLAAFGPFIKQFADSVDGINTEAVTAAANAGKMMAEMAKSLPNSGGVAGFFAGNNDMDEFGSQLVAFGEGIADFSTVVDGKVSESAVAAAVNAGKMISELAASLPNSGGVAGFFAGNNDMDDFGKQLTKFGEGIANFSESISGKVAGVDSAVVSIKKLISMFKSISGVNAEAVATFKESLSDLGKVSIKGLIKSFTDSDADVKASITKILNGVTSAINNKKESLKADFVKAGKYLVDGFAKGIDENTFKAEAKARAMALKAFEAAKKALDEHSPSKKFMKIGAFAVEGLANGITKNVGTSNDASVKMANGVLTSFQDELGIHSPSLVMNKQGHYIVQGVADGIKSDMSAEEAAEKKAQNITNAFQKALDNIDLAISNRSKDFDLWQLEDGKTASTVEILQKQKKKLNDDLWDYNQQVKLNTDKWLQLKDTFGENNEATKKAYGVMRDSQITAAQIAADYISVDKSIIEAQEESLDGWKTINENGLEIMELERANSKIYSDKLVDSQYLSTYKDNLNIAKTKEANAEKYFYDMLAKYGDMNHPEVQAAKKEWQESIKERLKSVATINDYEDSIVDRELQAVEDSRSHRQDVIDRWEAKYGDDASDYQRYLFYKNTYTSELDDINKEYRIQNNKYNALVKRIAEENGISIEAAKKTKEAVDFTNNVLYPLETEKIEGQNKIDDLRENYLEDEKEKLKDQYETASDIADIKYQIWELTTGRDATDAEKETMKLAVLTEQLGEQAKLVNMAKEAWENAKEDEKLQKEQEYWNARLQLAQLQSDVLDIQESIAKRQERALDRQRLAQDDYNDYIKKYEKYYLEHGMTREELEKDAKLVSGYDPNKAINVAVSKTNNAIDTIKTNMSNITSAVGEGIQNGISAVTDNTTTMLNSCADVISNDKEKWVKAGVTLVEGFISGIRSKIEDAVNAAVELASRTLAAIQSVMDSNMDYSPTITPVLDMSGVSAQASQLNSMLSGKTSFGLATSISRASKAREDLYSAKSLAEANDAKNVYSFTQNNYSPKSLSSTEIYRQTNNMISRIGKKVTV